MDWEYFYKCLFTIKRQRQDDANMQEGIFTMSKNTYSDLLTRWAHTQTHAHKMKRNPESLLDPHSRGERQARGQSSVMNLTIRGRTCSAMQHLTKVVGQVPSHTSGLVVRGGARVVNNRGPRREVRVALSFLKTPRCSHRETPDPRTATVKQN